MKSRKQINTRKQARARRSSARIRGSAERPRLAVFRSNRGMYAQLIDDAKGRTIVAVSPRDIKAAGKKTDVAGLIGEAIAKKASAAGIAQVVFDRRSYGYHGRVKALADGARKGGLKF